MALDSNFYSNSLLLLGEGVSGGTSVVDSSPKGTAITVNGDVTISSVQSRYGASSINFAGSTGWMTFPDATEFSFGSGDFTIDFWYYRTAANNADFDAIFVGSAGPRGIGITIRNAGQVGIWLSTGTTWDVRRGDTDWGSTSLTLNAWHHIAISRSGNNWYGFVDGVLDQSFTSSATLSSYGGTINIGHWDGSYTKLPKGYIDNFRVTKDVARFTSAFDTSTLNYDPPGSATSAVTIPTPSVACFGGVSSSATAPVPIVYVGSRFFAEAAVTAPMPTVFVGSGARMVLSAPSPTLNAAAHDAYGDNALIFTAPTATLSCYGGVNASLTAPSFTLSCTATGTALAKVEAQAPMATLTATGTAAEVANLAATAPMVNLVGYGGAVCSITTPMATVTVSGTGGATVGVAVTLPMFDVVASGTAQNYGSVIVAAPMARMATGLQAYVLAPMATLVAVGTATVAATYEAYAMNMKHAPRPRGQEDAAPVNEVTRYTNFPFTHIVRHKNSYYGVNSSGLYLLEGTTDNGTAIPYEARTHISDLDEIKLKTVVSAYFGGRLGAASTVTLYAGESTVEAYAFTTPRGAVAQNYRQKFGRGLKTRYFALGASGSAEFSIDNVAFEVATMTRRV